MGDGNGPRDLVALLLPLPFRAVNPYLSLMTKLLEKDGIAYDIAGHRDAPAGLRVWTGATIETSDIKLLTPWLDWAFETAKADAQKKAA